jgi:hypothetical protein
LKLRLGPNCDRRRYLRWVFEAKKRFGLSVLDYIVTPNHIHLLIKDTGPNDIAALAVREAQWSEAVAVGSLAFVEKIKGELGVKALQRELMLDLSADPVGIQNPKSKIQN